MSAIRIQWEKASVLDAAIVAGLVAVFVAVSAPLVRGALIRQRTAECARKMIRAAEAFDFYAESFGNYPQSQQNAPEMEQMMRGAFAVFEIDWWDAASDLGGQWSWYSAGRTASVVISGERVSEQRMAMLDRLIDDGNLETGVFQRRGSRYHYTIKDSVL